MLNVAVDNYLTRVLIYLELYILLILKFLKFLLLAYSLFLWLTKEPSKSILFLYMIEIITAIWIQFVLISRRWLIFCLNQTIVTLIFFISNHILKFLLIIILFICLKIGIYHCCIISLNIIINFSIAILMIYLSKDSWFIIHTPHFYLDILKCCNLLFLQKNVKWYQMT